MVMDHNNKVIFSVDSHTWMEMSLEALSDDIILDVSQLIVIYLYPTDRPVNSLDRPVKSDIQGQLSVFH